MSLIFNKDFDVEHGRVDQVTPMIRRVTANNPGAFTFRGTGTYIVGTRDVAVVDPGPSDDAHVEALLKALDGYNVTHILITHTHLDHSPAAAAIKAATGARMYGFGPHPEDAPFPEAKEVTDAKESENAEMSHDVTFVPDVATADGDVVEGRGFRFEAVHTPGHISNHTCWAFQEESTLFTGDHVMGWSTTVVSPPNGNMADYLASLHKLLPRTDATYMPTHGPAITDPRAYVRGLIAHRLQREEAVLQRLAAGDTRISDIVAALYVGLDERLVKGAGRSVLAHLVHLIEQGRVTTDAAPGPDAEFRLAAA